MNPSTSTRQSPTPGLEVRAMPRKDECWSPSPYNFFSDGASNIILHDPSSRKPRILPCRRVSLTSRRNESLWIAVIDETWARKKQGGRSIQHTQGSQKNRRHSSPYLIQHHYDARCNMGGLVYNIAAIVERGKNKRRRCQRVLCKFVVGGRASAHPSFRRRPAQGRQKTNDDEPPQRRSINDNVERLQMTRTSRRRY